MFFPHFINNMVKLLRCVHIEYDTFIARINQYHPVGFFSDDVTKRGARVLALQDTFREKTGMTPASVITGDNYFIWQVHVFFDQCFYGLRSYEGMVRQANEHTGR